MKTVKQIQNKAKALKNKLENKKLYENFGDKEQHQLEDFIGNVYEYSYDDRMLINAITSEFFNWCINYEGNGRG